MSFTSKRIHLRPANYKDCEFLWEWVNDPEVRKASFSSETIPWETHKTWFTKKLANPDCYIYIAIDENEKPVGQIRFDLIEDSNAEIDISVAPTKRGQGYGIFILRQGVEKIFNETEIKTVIALIKAENILSQHIFKKAGFNQVNKVHKQDNLAYKYSKIR